MLIKKAIEFTAIPSLDKRKTCDALVLPFWQSKKSVHPASDLKKITIDYSLPIETRDFKAKEGEISVLWPTKAVEKRVILLGLGALETLTLEKLRRSFGLLAKYCNQKSYKSLSLLLPRPQELSDDDIVKSICEGLLLVNYQFDKNKTSNPEEPIVMLERVDLIGAKPKQLLFANQVKAVAQGVYLTRDLVNGNADEITPQYLVQLASEMAQYMPQLKTTVFDKKRLQKEKMGLLLAVSKGSFRDPAMIIVEYKGDIQSKERTVLLGKGVTYDTGGLNLKPTGSMETMRCDMAGAATVLATTLVAAQLGLKTNVTAVIVSTENAIDANSYKPGDVYTSYSGKTVEVDNTDAEGRLILADALSYIKKNMDPTRVIDLATLTGAIVIALGEEVAGLMSNNHELADKLIHAGTATYERVWRMPLFEEYKEQLKSDFADIKNTGGRAAGSITAAIFLQEFIGDVPWAHLDIAGVAYLGKERRYHCKNGTGWGVRLLVEFLQKLQH